MGVLAAIGGVTRTLRLPRGSALGLTCLAGVLDTGGNAFFVLAAQAGRLDVAGVLSVPLSRRHGDAGVRCSCGSGSRGGRRSAPSSTLAAIGCVSS